MSAWAFAIVGALSHAFGALATRRAVIKVPDATVGTLLSVPIGVPFYLLILIVTGQISSIASFSWQSFVWLSAAGIIHFMIGRALSYNCVQLVGANASQIITRVSPLVTAFLGISVLSEQLTWELALGILLIVTGVVVIGLNPQVFRSGHGIPSSIRRKAFLFGIGAGILWGISPILVKLGLQDSASPVAGVFISYSAATITLGISLLSQKRRAIALSMKREAIGFFCLAGLFAGTAQLMKYIALSTAPASVIVPIFSISPVFLLLLSFLFNRKIEVFNPLVITGTIAVVIGSILLI